MLTAIIPPWHHLYVNVGLTEPYLKAEPSPVFFERNKQHLKSLMIALLILKT